MVSEKNFKNTKLITFLAALCLFLSAIEYAIPKPVPFFRLGLANLPILLGLYLLSMPEYFLLVLLKVLGQNLISGALFSYVFLFSLSGTVSASLSMLFIHRLFYKRELVTNVGISLAGALCNALSQLFIARILMFGDNVRLIAPPLLIMSLITGLVLGFFADRFTARSKWFLLVQQEQGGQNCEATHE